MCSRKLHTATLNATDDDWYLTEATLNNAIKLTKYLMQLYNININHVIMHHMVTGKLCPQPFCRNENSLINWYNFLTLVNGQSVTPINKPAETQSNATQPVPALPYTARVITETLNVRSGPGTNYPIVRTVGLGSVYTIVEEQNGFGRLKSGVGWISLKYIEKT